MIEQTIEHWDDISVTVIFSQEYEHAINFHVVEIIATQITESGVLIHERGWTKKGADSNMDLVYDPLLAERYIEGHVKWDGCSNIDFGAEGDGGYMHLCGSEGIERMSALLLRVFARCGDLLGDKRLEGVWT